MRGSSRLTALLIATGSALLLAGACTVGPDYVRPKVTTPEQFRFGVSEAQSFADLPWWDLAKDPQLQALIREAIAQNLDLRTAAARVEEARARAGIAKSYFYPEIGLSAAYDQQRTSKLADPPQDFIQKPFTPPEIRNLVKAVIQREALDDSMAKGYASCIELAKKCITDHRFEAAGAHLRKAVAIDPSRAETFNLLGAVLEIQGAHPSEALRNYHAALALDGSYAPARRNIYRISGENKYRRGKIDIDASEAFRNGGNLGEYGRRRTKTAALCDHSKRQGSRNVFLGSQPWQA